MHLGRLCLPVQGATVNCGARGSRPESHARPDLGTALVPDVGGDSSGPPVGNAPVRIRHVRETAVKQEQWMDQGIRGRHTDSTKLDAANAMDWEEDAFNHLAGLRWIGHIDILVHATRDHSMQDGRKLCAPLAGRAAYGHINVAVNGRAAATVDGGLRTAYSQNCASGSEARYPNRHPRQHPALRFLVQSA